VAENKMTVVRTAEQAAELAQWEITYGISEENEGMDAVVLIEARYTAWTLTRDMCSYMKSIGEDWTEVTNFLKHKWNNWFISYYGDTYLTSLNFIGFEKLADEYKVWLRALRMGESAYMTWFSNLTPERKDDWRYGLGETYQPILDDDGEVDRYQEWHADCS